MPFHGPELIVVLVIALLVFGPKRLPEMGSAVGKTFQAFKKSMSEPEKVETPAPQQLPAATETTPAETAR